MNQNASSVNWSLNQPFLLQCPSDVLMILDTCYAAKGGSNSAGPTKGANEVIAATNEVIQAPGVSRLSFTRVLVRVLKNLAERHRTENFQLSAVLLFTHMRNYYYPQELKELPYYIPLVNYGFQSCRIVPRPYSQKDFLGELSPLMPPDLGPFRVIVAVKLKETPSGDLVSWLQGQGAPAGYINGVELIKIEAAYLANSSMLLITLPPAVWLLLPPKIRCTFVGMVRSGNLLSQARESITANFRAEKASSKSIKQTLILDPPPPYEEEAVIISTSALDLQLRRENKYWIDRESRKARYRPSLDRYKYRHLAPRELRLIKLRPGQENDRLIGRVITVDKASAPRYVALSYAWGPPCEEGQDPPFILLDDIPIELRPNLDSAMRALRRLDQDLYIWVDALCIDQHDMKERNLQKPLMANIYRLSDSVAVWLGETTSYGKVAFSFATWITRHPDLVIHVAEQQLKVLLTALFAMIRNPWFQRKWVVADFVLAEEVNLHYGKDVLPWEIMAEALYVLRSRAVDLLQLFLHKNNNADSFLDFLADFRYQGVNAFVDLRDEMQRKLSDPLRISRIRLDELVTRTALLNARVIHDAVYTMIFLASEIMPASSDIRSQNRGLGIFWSKVIPISYGLPRVDYGLPRVDYDLTEQEVCSTFVRHTISSTRHIDIICRPWAPEVSNLPSWVRPRSENAFRVLDDNRHSRANADSLAVSTSTSTSQTLYSACGKDVLLEESQASYITLGQDPPVLHVEGFALGIVDMVAPPAMNGVLPKEWRKIAGRGYKGQLLGDWFWRTIVADRDPAGLACPPWYKLASEHVLQNSDGLDLDTRRLMFETSPGIVFDFLNRVQSVIWGRRLATIDQQHTLDQGYAILGPTSCQAGDLVCILYGCSVPVLLRQNGDLGNFTFIGECYVHGMMDGEAILLQEHEELPTKQYMLV